MNRIMALLAALALCLTTPLLLSKSDDATTIQVTDNRGRTIEVLYPCERIIFLVENAVIQQLDDDGLSLHPSDKWESVQECLMVQCLEST